MTDPLCWSVVQRLLERPESPAEDDLRHVRGCDRCNSMIAQAAKLDSLIAIDDEPLPLVDERLIERTETRASNSLKRARLVLDSLVAALLAAGAAYWFILASFYLGWAPFLDRPRSEFLADALAWVFPVSALVGVVFGLALGRICSRRPSAARSLGGVWIPLLLVIMLLAEYRFARFLALNHDSWFAWGIGAVMLTAAVAGFLPGRAGLPYKRLRRGRQVSGVCAGIAEATRVPVAIIRIVFVALVFAKMSGFLLYIVLDILMEVHPDDRASLFRFRVRRWWERRLGATPAKAE